MFDSGVLPQCDADGIGDGYFVKYEAAADPRKDRPGICPNCGSENVNFGDTEYGFDESWQDCGCKDCETKWHEIYKFDRKVVI